MSALTFWVFGLCFSIVSFVLFGLHGWVALRHGGRAYMEFSNNRLVRLLFKKNDYESARTVGCGVGLSSFLALPVMVICIFMIVRTLMGYP